MRILIVANKLLPENDYRLGYARASQLAQVTFGLPGKPASVRDADYVCMNFREGLSFGDALAFVSLFFHLRRNRERYDLVHFFSTKLQLFGPLCASLAGVRCVTTVTGFGRTFNRPGFRYRILKPIYLVLARVMLRIVASCYLQNRGDMQWLASRLPKAAQKLHWIGSGVECDIVRDKSFLERPLQVLLVARIMPDKGILFFLKTARRLAGKEFRFTLVGPHSVGEEALFNEVSLAHQEGVIDYRGELGYEELSRVYRENHIFVLPTSGEGMPRTLLEAGHALLCPIASDIPATRDLIAPERGFLLQSTQDPDNLAKLLLQLKEMPGLLESNSRAYQNHILKHYTVSAYTRRLDLLLSSLNMNPRKLPIQEATHPMTTQQPNSGRVSKSDRITLVEVTKITDLNHMVQIHLQAFKSNFMSQLGSRFLKTYYRTVIESDQGICLIARAASDLPVGFAVGFVDPPRFYQRLRSCRFRLFLSAVPALALRPWLIIRMLATARNVSHQIQDQPPATPCELASLAVAPEFHGQGIGKLLVKGFVEHATWRGAASLVLTTDAHDNLRVNRFYESLGFRVVQAGKTSKDRKMNHYHLDLLPDILESAA